MDDIFFVYFLLKIHYVIYHCALSYKLLKGKGRD